MGSASATIELHNSSFRHPPGSIGREMRIDVNADIGEADDADGIARDAVLFTGITSANIACGGHAGDDCTMRIAVDRAIVAGAGIGAHVSYPDREGFGRRRLELPAEALRASIGEQFDALRAVAEAAGTSIVHVKPHGALYNAIAEDAALARVVLGAVAGRAPGIAVFAMPDTAASAIADELGLPIVAEGFPERGYRADGLLQPRSLPGAIIDDPVDVGDRAAALALGAAILAVDGAGIRPAVATLCVHSDHPSAVANLAAMRRALAAADVAVARWDA